MLNAFKKVEGTVVLCTGGVYSVRDIYARSGSDRVYAGFGGGYVRLGPPGFTSKCGTSWADLESPEGRLGVSPTKEPIWINHE